MLSYRHAFHAGNFADVLKHATLALLVESLQRKEKPFVYVDTHAGAGRYDLQSANAQKNREYLTGIAKLWERRDLPTALAPYLAAVRALNPDGRLRYYPGSPSLVRQWLRPRDRMALCELHPGDFKLLQHLFEGDRQVKVQSTDGYQALKALLPPLERRALVLIDPAFERHDERARLISALQMAYQRFPTGVYAIWFPIMERAESEAFRRRLKDAVAGPLLVAELSIGPELPGLGMFATGMALVNPPWQLDEALEKWLPWLAEAVGEAGRGGWRLDWLRKAD